MTSSSNNDCTTMTSSSKHDCTTAQWQSLQTMTAPQWQALQTMTAPQWQALQTMTAPQWQLSSSNHACTTMTSSSNHDLWYRQHILILRESALTEFNQMNCPLPSLFFFLFLFNQDSLHHTRESISARNTPHKYNNKDLSRLRHELHRRYILKLVFTHYDHPTVISRGLAHDFANDGQTVIRHTEKRWRSRLHRFGLFSARSRYHALGHDEMYKRNLLPNEHL